MSNVRNFWLSARIDGRQIMLTSGPQGVTGGMDVNIYQRSEGAAMPCMSVRCRADSDGTLRTEVLDDTGTVIFQNVTRR